MSPSWRDSLVAELAPAGLRLARLTPAWRGARRGDRRLAEAAADYATGSAADGKPAWAPALAALREALRDPRWAGSEATVRLSNHFVRYLTIPWDEQLVTAEEQQAMVRHAFVQAHGSTAEDWALRWDAPPAPAPCLASAVDKALIDGLRAAFADATLRLASIQPRLMASLNAQRGKLPGGRDCWFLDEEAGRISLAWLHADAPAALYSQRVGDDWPTELPAVLERGLLLAGDGSAAGAVYLHLATRREIAAELPAGWSLHPLPTTEPPTR